MDYLKSKFHSRPIEKVAPGTCEACVFCHGKHTCKLTTVEEFTRQYETPAMKTITGRVTRRLKGEENDDQR